MNTSSLIMNGQVVEFTPQQTILQVAREHGVPIPTLCYLKEAAPTGACRMCLVEVKGMRTLAAACATPAAAGMEIMTESEIVHRTRRMFVELLLAGGNHNCMTCEASGDCRLEDLAYRYGITESRFKRMPLLYATEDQNPLIVRDFSRCIMCGRCVEACNSIQVNRAISFGYRGFASKIVTRNDNPYHESDCVFCGQCIAVCPVGALTSKKAKGKGRTFEVTKIRHVIQTRRLYSGMVGQ
jgi:NADH dehydrogenase/NADH:ubiquinone oxidoreductase subunit G